MIGLVTVDRPHKCTAIQCDATAFLQPALCRGYQQLPSVLSLSANRRPGASIEKQVRAQRREQIDGKRNISTKWPEFMRGATPPADLVSAGSRGSVVMRGYSHLSDDEREQIGLLMVLGHSIGAIARAIRRPKSTISRELSRNRLPSGRYSPLHAAGAYQLRRRREALIEKSQPCGASFSTASPKGGRPSKSRAG